MDNTGVTVDLSIITLSQAQQAHALDLILYKETRNQSKNL